MDLLVRAAWNRRVDHPERDLWTKVAAQPVVATLTVRVPRRGPQPARQATVAVRWCLVLLRPPTHRTAEKRPSMAVWAVQAVEEQPPAGCEPIEWVLLTTCAIHTPADAVERADWYACRWGIEVWHKVLRSVCRIDARQLETADRLRRCLAPPLCHPPEPGTARGAMYRPVGARGMAGTLLRHSGDGHAAGNPTSPAAGHPLDWSPGRLPVPPWRWRTRRHRPVERVSTSDGSHVHVPDHAPSLPPTHEMWVMISPAGEGE